MTPPVGGKDTAMSRTQLLSLLCIGSLALQACANQSDEASEPGFDELEDGLALPGKADGLAGSIEVLGYGVSMRGAAARTLYNLLDENDAIVRTRAGSRTLYAAGMGCITNGLSTYCLVLGNSEAVNGPYEAILHGSASASGARTLHALIADGSSESFVETPWFACEQAGGAVWCGVETSETVTLDFAGLEDSGDDFVYEGWAVNNGKAYTTDRFRNGPTVQQSVPSSIANDALYVLTIEPRRGDEAAPAATHLMAGALELGGATDIGTEHGAALGTDFANAEGAFILATPTSADTSDERQGIWFVDPVAGAPALALPELPDGWAYEGWVVGSEGPVSTGRFTDVSGDDSDGAGRTAGTGMSPPFPGQDFVSPPMDLLGATVVISVEPEPDNSEAPFAIKPLIAGSVEDVLAPTLQTLGNTSDNRPSATASFGL